MRKGLLSAAAVVVVAVAGVAGWWFLLRDDPPPEADIEDAAATLEAEAEEDADGGGDLDGTWEVDRSIGSLAEGTSTFAGYRIREELAGIGGSTAVGRTPEVTGEATIEATTVTAAAFEVDMTTLESDNASRDGQLRQRGLETDAFPTATFVLSEPIELGVIDEGEAVEVPATGALTLHGVTREVTIPLELVLRGERAAITGQLDVALADHDIEPPLTLRVLGIADTGVLELQLFLTRA